MSFKRDGDNGNLLKNLGHQRVRELLGSHVPKDEAKLLSNGRLVCTICVHRPIFDTINMISIHRQGKIHLRELSKYIKCKEDAAMKALRKQPPPEDEDVKESSRLKSSSKCGAFKQGRKPILELPKSKIPSKVPSILHSLQQPDGKSASACVRHYLKNMARTSSLHKVIERSRETYGVDLQKNTEPVVNSSSGGVKNNRTTAAALPQTTQDQKQHFDSSQNYEIKLRMSGWIKDSSGTWIKDPNVEFDSDEESVPPPPT